MSNSYFFYLKYKEFGKVFEAKRGKKKTIITI